MAVLKIVDKNYSANNPNFEYGVDFTLLNYITDLNKTGGCCYYGQGVCGTIEEIAQQFQDVRKAYHKETGRLIRHFIVSFDQENEPIDEDLAIRFGTSIARYYSEYQLVFALHTNTKSLHLHFVINTVSVKDGKKLSEGIKELLDLLNYCNSLHPQIAFNAWEPPKAKTQNVRNDFYSDVSFKDFEID